MRTLSGQEHIITVNTGGEPPEDLYCSAGSRSRSFCPIPTDDGTMLLVEGRKHPTGLGGDTMELTRKIESFATSNFPVEEITYRWSAQDYMTMDRVPYIGTTSPFSESVYAPTHDRRQGFRRSRAGGPPSENRVGDDEVTFNLCGGLSGPCLLSGGTHGGFYRAEQGRVARTDVTVFGPFRASIAS